MAVVNGRITRIGSVSGAQPQGRVWIISNEGLPNEAESAAIQVDTAAGSARWSIVMAAFESSRPIEIDVLATQPPNQVVDKVRITS